LEVERKSDIRLIGRAIREGWNVDKQMVVQALQEVVVNRDPELLLGAAQLLIKADEIDAKREAIEQREIQSNGDRRLQLLELAQRIPATELARFASDNGIAVDGGATKGRTPKPTRANGKKASGGKGSKNTAASKRKTKK
jgi:hypothetical protein